MSEDKQWPGYTGACHPEVFTVPPPGGQRERKPGQLTDNQLKCFWEEGFVMVEDVLKPEVLEPVKHDIEVLVDELAQKLYDAGKITKLYKEYRLSERLTHIEKEFPGTNILLMKAGLLTSAFRDLWSNDRLLNIAEQILGTEDISGHPVWNLRPKTPKNEATTVPWHQDCAYLSNESYEIMQLTAWIPLLDTDENNGCLQMMRGGHRSGKVVHHQGCFGDTWYVMLEEEEMSKSLDIDTEKDLVTCPVPYGGVLLFSNMIPHRSLNNHSDSIRWTMDLRWQRADKPVGFYGLKDGVQLRSSDPSFKIDWDTFTAVNRSEKQSKFPSTDWHATPKKENEFETTIVGPWMRKWEIVHVNRHVEKLMENEAHATDIP